MPPAAPVRSADLACHCGIFNHIMRALAVLSLLGTMVAAGYLVYMGNLEYSAPSDVSPFVSNASLGIFHVIIGVWFVLFGLLGVLGEVRVRCLRAGVLRPFGFLHTFVGRGCAYMVLGCVFCSLPVPQVYVTVTPGAALVISGVGQFVLGCFVLRSGVGGIEGAPDEYGDAGQTTFAK